MKRTHILSLVTVFVLAAGLVGCTKNIPVGGEKLPEDTTEISMALDADALSSLELFPALEKADLSGSRCYDEIIAWAKAHPEVEVRYSVEFPDGSAVPFDVKELSLGAAKSGETEEIISLMHFLPELEKVSFTGSSMTAADVSTVAAVCENIDIEFSFMLFSRSTDYYAESLDLTDVPFEEIEAALPELSAMPKLKRLELGSAGDGRFTWEQIGQIEKLGKQIQYDYDFELYGRSVNLHDRALDLNHIPLSDNASALIAVIPYMNRLETLDMDSCGVGDETMQSIREAFPDVEVIWRVWFGEAYSVRTDVERILASRPAAGGNLTPENTASLKYCTKVRYLDIGHNEILGDISFVRYMPELEVAIFAMDGITDLSPIAGCTKLEYLEVQTNPFTDLTPLSGLVNLEHLNIARNGGVTDLSPLFGLTKLQRLWVGTGKYSPEQAEELKAALPLCEINTIVYLDPTEGRWRIIGTDPDPNKFGVVFYHPRYEKLVEQFGYTDKDYSFTWNDPKY